jgi:hypothetical protein
MLQPLPIASATNQHNAFPALCMERPQDGGILRLVWRLGSDHWPSRDGRIMSAVSYNKGQSWDYVSKLRESPDYRDPGMAYIGGDNYLTWFGANSQTNMMGAGMMRNWGDPVRIDTCAGGAAITAPIVKLPDGRLGAAFYGRKAGETLDTAWMAWSSDKGATWTTNRIVNMIAQGISTPEPYLVVDGGFTYMFFRWGQNDGIGLIGSADSGRTWPNNATPVKILNNASGRPTAIVTSTGRWVMIYREPSTKNAVLVHSLMPSSGWSAPQAILEAESGAQPVGMTYASMVEISPGVLYVVCGMELPSGYSQLWGGTVQVPA